MNFLISVLVATVCVTVAAPASAQSRLIEHVWSESEIYPGTTRKYWVYLPDGAEGADAPLTLAVFQDGHAMHGGRSPYKAHEVFDVLMASGEMPPTVGVFIDPGHRGPLGSAYIGPKRRFKPNNRSVEYDTVDDRYATFLLEEILPAVERDHGVTLSTDPAMRLIGGDSSGGIAAFTAAWERPDAFGKVVSNIGSFVNIRGGHVTPSRIRKEARRPIRVHLIDNQNDLDNRHGHWWLANLQMKKALEYRGYDFQFVESGAGHNRKPGGENFRQTLRWMWRDWQTDPAADPIEDPHPIK